MGRAGATEGEVFFAFRLFLLARIDALQPRFLVIEAPFLSRPNRSSAAQALNPDVLPRLYGLRAHIVDIAEEFGLVSYQKQSTSVAAFFTGRGKFPGGTALERLRRRSGPSWPHAGRAAGNALMMKPMPWLCCAVLNVDGQDAPALAMGRLRSLPKRAMRAPLVKPSKRGNLTS